MRTPAGGPSRCVTDAEENSNVGRRRVCRPTRCSNFGRQRVCRPTRTPTPAASAVPAAGTAVSPAVVTAQPGRPREKQTLFFAGASLAVAGLGFLYHLQRFFRHNADGAPEALFRNLAGWLISISSLMTVGLLTAILAGMVWFVLSQGIVSPRAVVYGISETLQTPVAGMIVLVASAFLWFFLRLGLWPVERRERVFLPASKLHC